MENAKMSSLRKWVLGAGIFNTVAAFPLAMPFLYKHYYVLFDGLNRALRLGGKELAPPIEGANMLFINTAGLALCLVGLMLIYASMNLKDRIGIPFLNAVARLIFAILLVYYTAIQDVARILLSLAMIDLVIATAFIYYILVLKTTIQEVKASRGEKA